MWCQVKIAFIVIKVIAILTVMLASGHPMGLNPIGRPPSSWPRTSPPHLSRRKSISRIASVRTTSYRLAHPTRRRKAQPALPSRAREKWIEPTRPSPRAYGIRSLSRPCQPPSTFPRRQLAPKARPQLATLPLLLQHRTRPNATTEENHCNIQPKSNATNEENRCNTKQVSSPEP